MNDESILLITSVLFVDERWELTMQKNCRKPWRTRTNWYEHVSYSVVVRRYPRSTTGRVE